MFEFLNFLRGAELDWLTVTVRLVLAVICGGAIGIERERKGRAAGFRTHILICLGAAMTTLTSQYVVFELGLNADLTRIGAQVIAGVGFIGAGTVMVIKRRQIKGITTAAGIWTAAIVGLCCGAGFYEGALLATLLVLLVEILLSRLEDLLVSKQTTLSFRIEYTDAKRLADILDVTNRYNIRVLDIDVKIEDECNRTFLTVKLPRRCCIDEVVASFKALDGVRSVEKT